MKVYYSPASKRTYLVPNHYSHTIEYIKEALLWAKDNGITVPGDDGITIEILRGSVHSRMLSIEFTSATLPTCEFRDLDKNHRYFENLVY